MFGSKGGMTIRITFKEKDGTKKIVLFGNSYKHWHTQAVEYIFNRYKNPGDGWNWERIKDNVQIEEIEKSSSAWVGWGGLKWCEDSIFQEELNREGVQSNEPDNPNPRQYKDFKFYDYPYGYRKLKQELKRY